MNVDNAQRIFQNLSTQAKIEFGVYVVTLIFALVGFLKQKDPTLSRFIALLFIPLFIAGPLYVYMINCLSTGKCEKLSWALVLTKLVPTLMGMLGVIMTML